MASQGLTGLIDTLYPCDTVYQEFPVAGAIIAFGIVTIICSLCAEHERRNDYLLGAGMAAVLYGVLHLA